MKLQLQDTPLPESDLVLKSTQPKEDVPINIRPDNPKYEVYWRDQPASSVGITPLIKGQGWDNHQFETFDEALEYACDWMYDDDLDLEPDVPFDYSGHGHFVEIRTIKSNGA